MAIVSMNRNTRTIIKLLVVVGSAWFIVGMLFIRSSSPDDRPIELVRSKNDLEQFKPAQPEKPFELPPVPVIQRPLERVVDFFQKEETERNIIPPPLNIQLKKPTRDPNAPGELGKPFIVDKEKLSPEERKKYEDGFQNNAFNQYVSDMISIHRQLRDFREPGCKIKRYAKKLPDTSVIICFHNEAWSVLLRSVHSIIDRSEPKLIKEIILVDDFSDKPHLGEKLQKYMDDLSIVKILRMKKREGLIRARLAGAATATGTVLTFLDSHIECVEGWLEPLLHEIAMNKTTVATPVIDVIDAVTFEYHYYNAPFVGGFDWNLRFNWHLASDREKDRRGDELAPTYSPTMAGGLFSINREYFIHLGTYDAGMEIWGGENLEMSFRIWMCGGTLEIIPCSRVGHIFRERSPYQWKTGVDVVKKNSVRLAEVWMDHYKHYYYERINNNLGNYGDVSSRIALRKNLKCNSFHWYLKNVYPELYVPDKATYAGDIRNKANNYCIDGDVLQYSKPIDSYPCHHQGGRQYWLMSESGEIRRDDGCLDYSEGDQITLYMCHGSGGNQEWKYEENKHIKHEVSGKCLETTNGIQLIMRKCDEHSVKQIWYMQKRSSTSATNTIK